MVDKELLVNTLFEIRDYSKENGLDPDETIKRVMSWILALLKAAAFDGTSNEENEDE